MGLDDKGAQFLLAARGLGVSFERTATIGRQRLYATPSWLRRRLAAFGYRLDDRDTARLLSESDGFAEPFLQLLGAREVVSMDASSYEGASRVLNLNDQLPADLDGAFTTVVDAGSLEHVFDFPTAIGNCMRMVAPDGHFLAITVINNMMGHGFYQFSPELFYRVLSEANGFTVERMLVTEASSTRWYEVSDPETVGTRVQLRSFRPGYLCVAARRTRREPILETMPQQSDYVSRWDEAGTAAAPSDAHPPTELHAIERHTPYRVMMALKSLYHLLQATVLPFDRRSFRRVEITRLAPGRDG
jgi:hypothetical protein